MLKDQISLISKTISEKSRDYKFIINHPTSYFYLDGSPFGNCQMFSIAYFCNIITNIKDVADLNYVIAEAKRLAGVYKPLLIVDFNQKYLSKIESHLDFISITPYTSSNESKMISAIIKTKGLS